MRRFFIFLGPSHLAASLALLVSGRLRDSLTQPGMILFEKCLLHEVLQCFWWPCKQKALGERFYSQTWKGWHSAMSLCCEWSCVSVCMQESNTFTLLRLAFALSVWSTRTENHSYNFVLCLAEYTISKASLPFWVFLLLRHFSSWTSGCAHYRKIMRQAFWVGAKQWWVWAVMIFGNRTNSDSRFQTLSVEYARQFLIGLQPIVFLSLILKCK